jgi:di/tricarboxylate transporter
MGTIIGSPPNALAAGVLADAGSPMDFLRWMIYGLPIALLLTLLAWRVQGTAAIAVAGFTAISRLLARPLKRPRSIRRFIEKKMYRPVYR